MAGLLGIAIYFLSLPRRSGAPDAQCRGYLSEPLSWLDRDRLDHRIAVGHLLQSPLLPLPGWYYPPPPRRWY